MSRESLDIREPSVSLRVLRSVVRKLPRGRSWAIRKLLPLVAPLGPVRGEFHRARLSFRTDFSQAIAKTLFFYGYYEQNVTSVLLRMLNSGQSVIDVGAHLGYWTMHMASAVGERGRVISFEPNPRMYGELAVNVAMNGFNNVHTVCAAAAEQSGHRAFYSRSMERSVVGSLVAHDEATGGTTFDVKTVSIDAYCDEQRLDKIDILKMDIEGGELMAIPGMSAGIAAGRYCRVLLELHPKQLAANESSAMELLDVFRRAGYRCFRIENFRPGFLGRYSLRFADQLLIPDDGHDWTEAWPHYLLLAPGIPVPSR